MYFLGRKYSEGLGLEQDHTLAVHWFQKAAKNGSYSAMRSLGQAYENGWGVEKDLNVALKWYMRVTSEKGLWDAVDSGMFTSADYHVSLKGALRVSKALEADSALKLEEIEEDRRIHVEFMKSLEKVNDLYTSKQYDKFHELIMSLSKADLSGIHLTLLADKLYLMILEGKQDVIRSKLSGESRSKLPSFLAQRDVAADIIALLERAIEKEEPVAFAGLAQMYVEGMGVQQSYTKAVELFRQGVIHGDEVAMFGLGKCYWEGSGVDIDKAEALKLFLSSAESGNREAMFELGQIYSRGDGVEKDDAKAKQWYEKSADAGHIPAKAVLRNRFK